jgi:hypothetical protein
MFKIKELKRILECKKKDKSRREMKNLRTDELYNLYSSPNISRLTTSRKIRWKGHVAGMRKMRNVYI